MCTVNIKNKNRFQDSGTIQFKTCDRLGIYFFSCPKMFMAGPYCVIGTQTSAKIHVVLKWHYKCKDKIHIIC